MNALTLSQLFIIITTSDQMTYDLPLRTYKPRALALKAHQFLLARMLMRLIYALERRVKMSVCSPDGLG